MTTILQPTFDLSQIAPVHRFSTAHYLEMIEKGLLGPRDKVELIGGVILDMSPAGTPHNHYLIKVVRIFAPLLDHFEIAIQGTLTVSEGHVYDPDFMLLQKRENGYKSKLPDASDVALVIEASESSLRFDQRIKLPVYAAAGIPEYWIADLANEQIIVHRDSEGSAYRDVKTYRNEDVVSPLAAPELSFTVRQAFN